MHDAATSSVIQSNLSLSRRPARIVAACLLMAAILYAGIAATCSPQELQPNEVFGVFFTGAMAGLLLVLISWIIGPHLLDRRVRRRLVAVSLCAAAMVASLPLLIGEL
jgi:quinol-cytochrome oxidoreductase complex cytochrome b subunit